MALVDINSRGNVGKTGRYLEVGNVTVSVTSNHDQPLQQAWKFLIVLQKCISHFLCLVSMHSHSPYKRWGYIPITTSMCYIYPGPCCVVRHRHHIHPHQIKEWNEVSFSLLLISCIINSGQHSNINFMKIQVPTYVMFRNTAF